MRPRAPAYVAVRACTAPQGARPSREPVRQGAPGAQGRPVPPTAGQTVRPQPGLLRAVLLAVEVTPLLRNPLRPAWCWSRVSDPRMSPHGQKEADQGNVGGDAVTGLPRDPELLCWPPCGLTGDTCCAKWFEGRKVPARGPAGLQRCPWTDATRGHTCPLRVVGMPRPAARQPEGRVPSEALGRAVCDT